jgi:Integrase core domain
MTQALTHPLRQMLDVDNAAAVVYACEGQPALEWSTGTVRCRPVSRSTAVGWRSGRRRLKVPMSAMNANWFLSLDEARAKCEAWRTDYNEVRPHSAIGNKTLMEPHRTAASPASCTSDEAGIF